MPRVLSSSVCCQTHSDCSKAVMLLEGKCIQRGLCWHALPCPAVAQIQPNAPYFRNDTEKLQWKGNSFIEFLLPFLKIRIFIDTPQSYAVATIMSHLYTSQVQKISSLEPDFVLHNDSPNVDNIIRIGGGGQYLSIRCHCNKAYPFSDR